jgi:hypothetical protein
VHLWGDYSALGNFRGVKPAEIAGGRVKMKMHYLGDATTKELFVIASQSKKLTP